MKKVFAFVLVLTLCLSLVPAAFASEEPGETVSGEDALAPIMDEDAPDITEPVEAPTEGSPEELKAADVPTEDGARSGDFTYTLDGTNATITDYTGSATTLTIPAQIEGYPVTSIGLYAFDCCSSLTSVTIPKGVTSIGGYAFDGCYSLTRVTIPEGVTSIGNYAFNNCVRLTSVIIPEGVTKIGKGAFYNCSNLTSVKIPESVTSIGEWSFYNCRSLMSVTIPEGVTKIWTLTFCYCSSLTSVTIPKSMTRIWETAFESCSRLTDVYYGGTQTQWNDVSIDRNNDPLFSATIHYESYAVTFYAVTYNANGGSGVPYVQTKAHDVALSLSTITPTRTGYTFLGWATTCTATTVEYSAGGTYTSNADVTLYAVWKPNTYTVTYDANGGHGAPSPQLKTHDIDLTLSTIIPTREGYTFLGWATKNTATAATYSTGNSYTDNADVTLYAVWKLDTYSVTYDANGGYGAPYKQTKTHDVALTLTAQIPTLEGYTFQGWAKASTATTAEYSAGGSYTGNADVTLYAVWKLSTYVVTYDANGGYGAPLAQIKTHDVDLTLSSTEPTRTGYTFQGWATTKTATTATYEAGASYTNNAKVTLYAVWKADTYAVNYDANGGTGAPEGQKKTHDVALTLCSAKPTREGYTFLGWATSSAATIAEYNAGGNFKKNADVTLYAVWRLTKPCIVTADATAIPGETISVEVWLQDNPGLCAMQLTLLYDENILTLERVINGELFSFSQNPNNIIEAVHIEDVTDDGILFTYTFRVNETAPRGQYTIGVSQLKCFNFDEETVSLDIENGTLTVADNHPGDVNGDGFSDSTDLVILAKHLSGASSAPKYPDVNWDGVCDLLDLVRLMKLLAK